MLALDAQRLDVGDAWRECIATTSDVLAVAARVLIESLVVDGQLALQRHVIERGHPARPHDREATLLVWVEPAQMQVSGEARGEAQEAENHVFDAVAHV